MNVPARPLLARLGIGPRIMLVFVLVFGLMGGLGQVLMRSSLLPTFDSMERSFALDSAKRVLSGFDEQMATLSVLNRDWAFWDALHAHLLTPDPAFARTNISVAAMQAANLNAVLLLDRQGQARGFGVRPLDGGGATMAQVDLSAPLLRLWQSKPASGLATECGLTRHADRLLAVCWSAVRHSDGRGPVAGTVVMARELTSSMLDDIAKYAGAVFTVDALPASAPVSDGKADRWRLSNFRYLAEGDLRVHFVPGYISLQYLLESLEGQPLSWVSIQIERKLTAQARRVLGDVLLQLAALALATGVVLLATVHWWLVHPIGRLRADVQEISSTKRWDTVLDYDRPDEIGALTQGVNSLLAVLREQLAALKALSGTDALTGIANRRQFDERLAHELARLGRHSAPLSLLLMDVDHFKLYNDHYGHPQGDNVLRSLGLLLRTVGRTQDMPARVGGEEFALLLPDTDTAGAQAMADKVMQALAQLELPHAASPTAHRVSVSVGVVTWAQSGSGGAVALLAQADKALYAAKHGGRMRACVYGTPEVPRL